MLDDAREQFGELQDGPHPDFGVMLWDHLLRSGADSALLTKLVPYVVTLPSMVIKCGPRRCTNKTVEFEGMECMVTARTSQAVAEIDALYQAAQENVIFRGRLAASVSVGDSGERYRLLLGKFDANTTPDMVSFEELVASYEQLVDRLADIAQARQVLSRRQEVADLGEQLHAMGGMAWMRRAYEDVADIVATRRGSRNGCRPCRSAPHIPGISTAWSNVGD